MNFLQTTAGLVLLGAITLSLPAHAGGGVSGGGNVLACKTDEGTETYQLLDYYENSKVGGFGFELDLGPGKTYPEKVKYVLARMVKYDGHRSRAYQVLANSFIQDSSFSQNGSATASEDLGGGMILPAGCEVKRVVILKSEEQMVVGGSKKKYEIVKHLWDQLDEVTKAGLIIHEISYNEAIKKGGKKLPCHSAICWIYFLKKYCNRRLFF
ncbi:MAG: hypothetical protein IPK04_01400 [Bdellovibrionales bacterium]|nr:hypothetical protein [Bdellovibrionales bacterium]